MKKRMTAASPKIKTLEADAGYNLSVHSVMVVRKIYVCRVSTDEESNNERDNPTRITDSSGTTSRIFNARHGVTENPQRRSILKYRLHPMNKQLTKEKRANVLEVALENGCERMRKRGGARTTHHWRNRNF